MRAPSTLLLGFVLLGWACGPSAETTDAGSTAGCSKDTDCKGTRVCVFGLCQEPFVATGDGGPPAAQDGGLDAGEDAGTVVLPDAGSDCARLCDRASACGLLGPAPVCTQVCQSQVSSAGPVGAMVVAACAGCLESHACAQVSAGTCDGSCPSELWGNSQTCDQHWSPDGGDYLVRCHWSTSRYVCDCYIDGVDDDSFDSPDFCTQGLSGRTSRARTGCHWSLP